MGYYTRYELEHNDRSGIDHAKEVTERSDYTYLFDDQIKWYDHEKDMRKYSKEYPNVLFELSGEGEETGDLWIEYYKNGKMQLAKAKITYDAFNEERLE